MKQGRVYLTVLLLSFWGLLFFGGLGRALEGSMVFEKGLLLGSKNGEITFLVDLADGRTEKMVFKRIRETAVLDLDGREIKEAFLQKGSEWWLEVELKSGQGIPIIRKMKKLKDRLPE